jgi:hypothetical protein
MIAMAFANNEIETKSDEITKNDHSNNSILIQLIQSQMKKELKNLKSSMTDQILEEVIGYYGQKISENEELKQEVDDLNKKFTTMNKNFHSIGQNFKKISKNHRNLVDLVRNKFNSIKSQTTTNEKNMEEKLYIDLANQTQHLFVEKMEIMKKALKKEILDELENNSLDFLAKNVFDSKHLLQNNSSFSDARKLVMRHQASSSNKSSEYSIIKNKKEMEIENMKGND